VEGKVESERKGGFAVALAGGHAAFCPYSQIDLFKQDAAAYLGQKFLFLIAEYEEFGDNVVLTRRRLLEREREKLLEELKAKLAVGDTRPGVVRRFMPFGVFVDIGSGVEGLVPLRELSWGQGSKPEDFLSVGEEITVVIREIDWEKQRISLGLREAQGDPWGWADRVYLVGKRCEGVVTRLMPFGAFVELERGIEGLVHVSRMGGPRIKRPDELVKIGDRVEVSVESVDLERRRIALAMDSSYGRTGEGKPETRAAEGTTAEVGLSAGSTLAGVVDSIRDFGVFVKLPGGKTGLLHVSQVELRGSSNRIRALHDMFPPGSELQVVIREITGDRVSLTLTETIEREKAEAELRQFQDEGGKALGSLGDVLKGLTL
jgi:small subunit ribosomal protein S1